MIDLHCHSYYSDGLHSPEELIAKAKVQGLRYLALTDHDTMAGMALLHQAAIGSDVTIINGIELSIRWKKYDIHILGLNIQNPEALTGTIDKQLQSRVQRGKDIGIALEACGVTNAYHKVCEIAGHEYVSRPHFAKLLVQEGKVKEMQGAFRQYLGRGKPAYIPTEWISVDEAVNSINQAGGMAVLAHPLKYGLTRTKLHELIKDFKETGGSGIEVVSGEMTITQVKEMAGTANRFNLLASSGSDFHGESVSRIALGRQLQLPEICKPIWETWSL